MAQSLQDPTEEPLWPLEDFCENTVSDSIVLGDLGNRTALLGNRAECTEHTIDVARSPGAATFFITGHDTFAIDAADTKPVESNSVAESRYAATAGSDSSAQQPHAEIGSAAIAIRVCCR